MTIKVSHFVGLLGIGGVQRNFCEYIESVSDADIVHRIYTIGRVDSEYAISLPVLNILNVSNFVSFIRDIVSNETIIHFYNNLSSIKFFALISTLPAKKIVMHERGGVWNTSFSKRFVVNKVVKKIDVIIANSYATKEILNQKFNVSKDKIRVIHNGIDISKFTNKAQYTTTQKNIIGFLGRFDTPKGIKILIDAVKYINTTKGLRNDFELHIAGDGPLRGCLKAISKNIDNIKFIGRVDNPYVFLSKIDILIIPSIREPLGNVSLEAGLCKVAVIASNIDGIPEIIDDNVSGKLITPKDALDKSCYSKESVAFPEVVFFPERKKIDAPLQVNFKELSDEIIILMNDDKLRDYYANNLNKRVIKYFNINRYASELHDLYKRLS